MSKEFIDAITRLAKCKVLVYVMSAEKKSRLEELFPDGTVGLSAELGCFYKHPCFANIHTGSSEGGLNDIVYAHKPTYDENHATNVNSSPNIDGHNGALSSDVGHSTHKWISLVSETESSWKKKVMPIFELYAKSIPQSRLEDKDINVVWHSKSEDQTHRSWQALELKEVITNATMNMFLTTFIDNKKLILKPTSTDRCIAITSILQDYNSANEKLISYRGMPYRYKISSNSILQTNTSDRQPDTAVKINDDDICILASDSRYEDEQFQSLFGGININTVKSPFKAKAVRPRNAMMFFVGGKKHAGAQYYLDDTRSLINLLNFIAASLSQSA